MDIADIIRQYDFGFYYYLYRLGEDSAFLNNLFYFFARYGIVFFFFSFIYLTLKKKIRAFLCILLAMGVAGLADFLVFIFWRRPLPFITHANVVNADVYGMYSDISSFPSSHTYIAFAIAISIFLYGHKRLGAVLFLLAMLVALGRIGVGLHYPSDVIAGALLGVISGVEVYLLVRKWEEKEQERNC